MKIFKIEKDITFDLKDLHGKTLRIAHSVDQNIEIISALDLDTKKIYILEINENPPIKL